MTMEEFVVRYIVRLDDGRYMMYDDREDVEDADDILVVKIPLAAANMFDAVQTSWFIMQNYCDAQWEIMQGKLAAEAGEEVPDSQYQAEPDLYRQFAEIVLENNLRDIFEKDSDDE